MSKLIFKDAARDGGNHKEKYALKYLKVKEDGKSKKGSSTKGKGES
jgi:hypothetical protein